MYSNYSIITTILISNAYLKQIHVVNDRIPKHEQILCLPVKNVGAMQYI